MAFLFVVGLARYCAKCVQRGYASLFLLFLWDMFIAFSHAFLSYLLYVSAIIEVDENTLLSISKFHTSFYFSVNSLNLITKYSIVPLI